MTCITDSDVVFNEKVDVSYIEGVVDQPTAEKPNHRTTISAEEKKLIRKIDWKVLPWLCVIGFLQFTDKVSLSYASVLGIIPDTHLQGAEYGALGSLFYVGYLSMQLPNSYMMQRFPLGKLVGTIVVIWGAILALTSLGKNFAQLAGLRFLLGFFEACVNPNFMLLTSLFYRKQEITSRLAAWWLVNGLCSSFGGLMAYGIGHMEGDLNVHAWQWLMIILGAATSVFGVFVFFFLIDDPRSPRLNLTEEEKVIMEERLRDTGIKQSNEINWSQVKECFRDPKTYAWFLISLCINISNGALLTFGSLITVGLGFSGLDAILLGIPAGFVDIAAILIASWLHGRTGDSLYTAVGFVFTATVGLIFLITLPTVGKLVGLYLVTFYIGAYILFLGSITGNTSGYTKKILTNAMVLIGYTIGNMIGPLIMTSNQAPLYVGGVIGCIAANVVAMVTFIAVRIWMARMNKMKASNPSPKVEDNGDLSDLVDPNFVYRL
ncbi:hypothetical protein K450DRAFT_293922 [Umbelopsis ramanniana AG]|uniref:Major facilitator superfamily (MFS) profile domain-containing protein n=1 Tax=Umbelopsis ramanniana AG TaxID=1314678 RepID=A0AAD5EF72_UMBRA|nr:uncharacterized protein K450DRAFT_293922 [Umbelopsis ramanniana AG]KAI8582339.1 hypothetical protein K450DRAFT_293922 [Umbelopsis ramanniana AG]